MSASSLDIEFGKYWQRMTPFQQKAVLDMIKAFMSSSERTNYEKYNEELLEAEAEYIGSRYINSESMLKHIRDWQNESTN